MFQLNLLFSKADEVMSKVGLTLFQKLFLKEFLVLFHELLNFLLVQNAVTKSAILSFVAHAGGVNPFARKLFG